MYNPFPWMGFIFWAGLFTWFGIRAWARYLSELERQKTLRAFAERGTPLDKEMVEKLLPNTPWPQSSERWQGTPENTVRGLAIGGIIASCVGLGLVISSWALRRMHATDRDRASGASDDRR